MKHIKTFENFVNEGVNESELNALINEGALARRGASDLADYDLVARFDEAEDEEWTAYYQLICDTLGGVPTSVFEVDSETNEDNPTSKKIFEYLDNQGMGEELDQDCVQILSHLKKINVCRCDDYGFVGFYFTANSKF
jgi:hypothetical protein